MWVELTTLFNHKVGLNAENTKYVAFSTSTSDSDYPAIKTSNATLAESSIYLGIWLDGRLIFNIWLKN